MNKMKHAMMGAHARDYVIIMGSLTLGGSGAISSTTGFAPSAAAAVSPGVVKTATKTGRYTVTLDRSYKEIILLNADLVGPTDAAFGNTNANAVGFRNRTAGTGNAAPASFDIQLMLASTGADTDGASGTEVHWAVAVRAY